jgi:Tfp pilus assembly protein PilW
MPLQTTRSSRLRLRGSAQAGLTLVEIMIATLVSTFLLVALLTMAIQAYKMNHAARLRDKARVVLRTFGDQFLRLSAHSSVPVGGNTLRALFVVAPDEDSPPTGRGLAAWGQMNGRVALPTDVDEPLVVNIGTETKAINALVTRSVHKVDAITGSPLASTAIVTGASGTLLSATFFIEYIVDGRTVQDQLSLVRLVE